LDEKLQLYSSVLRLLTCSSIETDERQLQRQQQQPGSQDTDQPGMQAAVAVTGAETAAAGSGSNTQPDMQAGALLVGAAGLRTEALALLQQQQQQQGQGGSLSSIR
jgi:hypothetical protein